MELARAMPRISRENFYHLFEYDYLVEKAGAAIVALAVLIYTLTAGNWLLLINASMELSAQQLQRTYAVTILYTVVILAGLAAGLLLRKLLALIGRKPRGDEFYALVGIAIILFAIIEIAYFLVGYTIISGIK